MQTATNTVDSLAAISDSEISIHNQSVHNIVSDLERDFHHRVTTALKTHPNVPDRQVRIEAAEGRVVIHGRVQTYFHKQMAQEALRNIHGINQIENRLEVAWD